MIQYHLIEGDDIDNVVALDERTEPVEMRQADSSHPHWWEILDGLDAGDEDVFELFDVQQGLAKRLTNLSDRIAFDGDNILFDDERVASPLADHLVRVLKDGTKDYKPLVRFWEKIHQNPSMRSREQLFTWLRSHDFTITESGDILGYKGVRVKDGGYASISQGSAKVNGKAESGAIPNPLGAVVEMPREQVMDDPNAACHQGLHVGDWTYASGFARGAVLEVHVNPADVVSIPRDSGARKMRTCRYKVVGVRTVASTRAVELTDDAGWTGDVGYTPV